MTFTAVKSSSHLSMIIIMFAFSDDYVGKLLCFSPLAKPSWVKCLRCHLIFHFFNINISKLLLILNVFELSLNFFKYYSVAIELEVL